MKYLPIALGLCAFAFASPALAQNDDCSGALPISTGTITFQTNGATTSQPGWPCASGGKDIWFSYTGFGGPVTISLCGSSYDTALQVFTGTCAGLTSVVCNDDICNNQSSVTFDSTAGQPFLVRVGGYQGDTGSGSLTVTDLGPQPLGTNYCNPVPNSTGATGSMSAFGSIFAVDNNLALTASDLPDGQFGMFHASQTQDFIPNPGSSMGVLCMSGNVAILYSQVGQSIGGSYSIDVDLGSVPLASGGPYTVLAGETWHFQLWHRDFGGTNNFTDAIKITFQ